MTQDCKKQKRTVSREKMTTNLRRLGEIATLHPNPKTREGLKDVILTIHNKHLAQ